MPQHLIIGIDPGSKGAMAVYRTTTNGLGDLSSDHWVYKFENRTVNDIGEELNRLWEEAWKAGSTEKPSSMTIYLENPAGVPMNGPTEQIKFRLSAYGKLQRSVGVIEGELIGLTYRTSPRVRTQYHLVSPQKWMNKLQCRTGGDKNITKSYAQRLYGALKPTLLTGDAICIMHYGKTLAKE